MADKMVYIKEFDALFNSPEVKEPTYESVRPRPLKDALEAYQSWLSSKAEIIGEHNWQDGQEVKEGVDFYILNDYGNESITPIKSAIPIKEDTSDIPSEDLEVAKAYWEMGDKLNAVKTIHKTLQSLKDSKKYCEDNFGPNVPNLDGESVASHSVCVQNNIQLPKTKAEFIEWVDKDFKSIISNYALIEKKDLGWCLNGIHVLKTMCQKEGLNAGVASSEQLIEKLELLLDRVVDVKMSVVKDERNDSK